MLGPSTHGRNATIPHMPDALLTWIALALGLLNLIVLVWLALRANGASSHEVAQHTTSLAQQLQAANERLERELRQELTQNASGLRTELGSTLANQSGLAARTQAEQMAAVAQQLSSLQKNLSDTLSTQLQSLSESNARRIQEVRGTLEQQLTLLQASNATKLDEMRRTVDEKLHATLEARLGESFKQVAERLEQVHRGLGEMQTLAQGVGDLKHLLSGVKTRGIFGEAQLSALLEQVFTAEQFSAQVATKPGSRAVVDFAIRLPGKGALDEAGAEQPMWLPIDAKFPTEDYERLLAAQDDANLDAAREAGKALESRIRQEAKSMADKYLAPPHTTDFAILFLPTEGLYAEVLRRPGLHDAMQREHRVTIAGPTTLVSMLSALQMGFRTLALEKRSSEVWQVLGAVKTEFGKFGDVLARLKTQTQTVLNTLDAAQTRSNQMTRALKNVERLPQEAALEILPPSADSAEPQDG